MTDRKAVHITLSKWLPGVEKWAQDICKEVHGELLMQGSSKEPMQTTIMRQVRLFAAEFGIICVSKKGKYKKVVA